MGTREKSYVYYGPWNLHVSRMARFQSQTELFKVNYVGKVTFTYVTVGVRLKQELEVLEV